MVPFAFTPSALSSFAVNMMELARRDSPILTAATAIHNASQSPSSLGRGLSSKAKTSPVVDKLGDTATLPGKRYKLSPTAAMGAGWKAGLEEWKMPSVWLLVMQWVRRNILVKGVDLERFRADDMPYLDKLVDDLYKGTQVPSRYPKPKGDEALKKMARKIIRSLFVSKVELPYQIGHWYVEEEWKGMGLFATRQVSTQTIADEFAAAESQNCELVWADAIHEGFDSVYTGRWSETKKEAQKYWYQKKHLLSGKHSASSDDIGFAAKFAVYGRLMFANHHPKAPFFFKPFTPKTPYNVADRFKGKLTIDVHTENYVYDILPGQQILVHYDFNLSFGDKKASDQIEAEIQLAIDTASAAYELSMARELEKMTALEEVEMVMSEVVMEKGRSDDDDEFVPSSRKRKAKAVGKGKKIGRRKVVKGITAGVVAKARGKRRNDV